MQATATNDGTTCISGFYAAGAGSSFEPYLTVKLADPPKQDDDKLSTRWIGIIAGAGALVIILASVTTWYLKRKKGTSSSGNTAQGVEMK
jgi:hypothetical protein